MAAPEHGLFLDREGTWWHDGDPVTHVRLAALLHRSIVRGEDGALVVTTGRDRMPFTCEDTPLRVLSARVDGQGVRLHLSNEREEVLNPATLRVEGDDSWRCVAAGGLEARFTRAAQLALMEAVVDQGDAGFALEVGGLRIPLPGTG